MKITFVNHASVLIESRTGSRLLTYPWPISPAFGGWIQHPSPCYDVFKDLNLHRIDPVDGVLISHGHDDHLDEHYVSKSLSKARFFVPQLPNKGLVRRLNRLGISDPYEVGEDGVSFFDFKVSAIRNTSFSTDDAIQIVSDSKDSVLLANDNWRTFDRPTAMSLKRLLSVSAQDSRYFFVQIGIADAYPWSYPLVSNSEYHAIVVKRLSQMVSEVLENAAALEITSVHVYANQSQIVSGWKRNARSPQQILLEDVLPLYPQISQRVSGDVIERGTVYLRREQSRSPSLSQELLKGLENSASSYLVEKLGATRGVLPEVQF
ncbi:MAG: MBL fold metallo-hydrolase, partial [Acidimicrobiaceae bacterium]